MHIIGPVLAVSAFLGFSFLTTSFLFKENPPGTKTYYKRLYLYHLRKSNEHKKEAIKALRNYKQCK